MKHWVLAGLVVMAVWCAAPVSADDGGWDYLIDKLTADGVSVERVVATFQDPRVERFTGLDFSIHRPREPRSLYRGFLRPRTVAAARRCRARYAEALENAERAHGVSAGLVAAILFVESGCGDSTGSHLILPRLARLAMANAPENVRRNLVRYADDDGHVDSTVEVQLRQRARELEGTFYPEVRALFTVAERLGVNPLDIRGSKGGAFGAPQFLPTSYLADGVDADGDGRVSLDDPADAAASCARFLADHGWRPGLSRSERRAVIWQYNRSDAYVDSVLTLAARIQSGPATPHTTLAAGKRNGARRAADHSRRHRTASKTIRS
jgi:peptidoglycan lytic transglycosylase B